MRHWRLPLLSAALLLTLPAHDIITTKLTFTRDVSRILVARCEACHSAQASIPLVTYEQVRPWAVSIKEQVLSRQMPPWGAVKGFGHLVPDEGLTQEEVLIIAAWVIGGAPKGNPLLLPPPLKVDSLKPLAALKDLLVVTNHEKVKSQLTIAGIHPLPSDPIDSARIVVHFPDGHIEPLLWLSRYNPAWNRTFTFRAPLTVPAGAVIESSSPLKFALESTPQP